VAQADVVIENLRPGAMARLGLAAEGIWAVNPRVVYASGSGWGQDGPLAPLPGLDIMAQARSGIMSITGTPGGEPVKVGVPVCDLVCGLYLALGVTAALRERDRIGVGQAIDVSLFEAGVSLAVWEAGKYFATGEVGGPLGSAHQSQAPYQAFQTSDGWVTIGANTPNTWAGLCRTLDMADELADEGYGDATRRHARRGELLDVIESRTRTRTTADLLAALGEAGVPCAPINDYGQVFTDDHLTARNFFWDAPHPALGPVRQIGSPMRLSRSPAVRGVAGPPLGADTRAVLARYGVPADVVDAIAGPAGTPDTAPTDEAVAVPRHPQPPAPGEGA
jgi:crotonobetainyl-CoA:carnitine CoA-transferase CaiB-like acyl-CoA transferase